MTQTIRHGFWPASGATVMLDVASGNYYGLNAVGARIWELLLEGPLTVSQLRDKLCEEFEIDPQTCEAAVMEFVGTLISNGIIHAAAP